MVFDGPSLISSPALQAMCAKPPPCPAGTSPHCRAHARSWSQPKLAQQQHRRAFCAAARHQAATA
eukprot:5619765-Alexandrium_andersonii.AAC.1